MEKREKQSAAKPAGEGACTHKLKCVHCHKEFNPVSSRIAQQGKAEPIQHICKTNHVHITLNVQHERKGLFKWLAGFFW